MRKPPNNKTGLYLVAVLLCLYLSNHRKILDDHESNRVLSDLAKGRRKKKRVPFEYVDSLSIP